MDRLISGTDSVSLTLLMMLSGASYCSCVSKLSDRFEKTKNSCHTMTTWRGSQRSPRGSLPLSVAAKLLAQLEKASSHQRLLTRPTSSWVNLQLINRWLHHSALTSSGARIDIKHQIISHIMGRGYYTLQPHEYTDVILELEMTNPGILLGTSEACVW